MAMGSALIDESTDVRQGHDRKMLDSYPNEDSMTVRIIKQLDCFFCHRPWYLSEAKLFWHQNKQLGNPSWRFPTSCPECRKHSRQEADQAYRSVCPTGKKEFVTAAAADSFSREALQTNGIAPQRTYQCPDCKMYHLTSREAVAQVSSGPLASPLGKAVLMAKSGPRKKNGETRAEIVELIGLGLTVEEIASRLSMTVAGVQYHKQKLKGGSPTPKPKPAAKPAVVNVETLDSSELDAQADRLYAQLEEIERKKARLIEARMLRVDVFNGAIRITKEGEHMLLPFEEREKLMQLLSQLAPSTAVAATGTN